MKFTQTFKSFQDLGPVRDYLQRQVDERNKQAQMDKAWRQHNRKVA